MIVVTERAKEVLRQLAMSANLNDTDVSLRLAPAETGQLGLSKDREKAGDQVVEHGGRTVLLIDPKISGALVGTTIDCEVAADGLQLVLRKSATDDAKPT